MSRERTLDRARRFLGKRAGFRQNQMVSGSLSGIRQVVVIPVLAEEDRLFHTLASLGRNGAQERAHTLVICVVNNRAEPHARPGQVEDNQRTLGHLDALVHGRIPATDPRVDPEFLRLAYVDASSPGCEIGPEMGVGEARRIGLDRGLAILTANSVDKGLLFCLDADTIVEDDYLREVRGHFDAAGRWSAVVGYAHCLPANPSRRAAIVRYEIFLRYHELGLRSAGSPYAYPTIGSTIVTRCDAYVACGGMNRRQAGEDFYFLQQLAKTGGVSRVDSTTVHPSARSSDRVPFGTGASIGRHLSGEADGSTTYHPESYRILCDWLNLICCGLENDAADLLHGADEISSRLGEFLRLRRFDDIWPRLQRNAPHSEGLEAQFHRWFDGFKTLKLIHYLRDHQLPLAPLSESAFEILERFGSSHSEVSAEGMADSLEAQETLLCLLRKHCAAGGS
ncbi:MAG: hypothetical protein GY906_03355 [bacterium]|nr:hypothetical protein [bacterium]